MMYKPLLKRMIPILALLAGIVSCSREPVDPSVVGEEGGILIALDQSARTVVIKSDDEEESSLPPVDSFWVEVYNSSAVRLYRDLYANAKDQVLKLNAGDFRLVAHHGDSLGAGFGKPYYLADSLFTVHGYNTTHGVPEVVSATAKLANVKLAVRFGENLQTYYSNYYAVVRHEHFTKKKVRFNRTETREGYIPGGNLYLEVFAQLAGTGMQDGGVRDSIVYFKSAVKAYDPNDFVTFNVDCGEREGFLDVNILVDKEVELVEQNVEIPSTALPKEAPYFMFRGTKGTSFIYSFPVGAGSNVADATVSLSAPGGIAAASLAINNSYLTGTLGLPATVDLINLEPTEKAALNNAGITWNVAAEALYGFINVCGVTPVLSIHSDYHAADPTVATFTMTVVDNYGKSATAVLNMNGEPIEATIHCLDYNIWGWKMVSPYAIITNVNNVNTAADLRLQYSLDGNSWSTVTKTSISGNRVNFNNATGLTAGRNYKFRVIANQNTDNVSSITEIPTEDPEQVPNAGFEEYTENSFICDGLGSYGQLIGLSADITWWQPYTDTKFWAVNSPVSMRKTANGPDAYTDYKSFPTVSWINDGYSGKGVMIATIGEDTNGSDWTTNSGYHVGELFVGRGNDQQYDDWAKVSEGGTFSNRPASLKFMYKLDVPASGYAPFYVHIEILDADGNVIGQGTKNDVKTDVSSWTACTIPVSYSVTNKKAASIKMSFMSCQNASDKPKVGDSGSLLYFYRVDVNTLSGSHRIHAANILYLDNVEMLYQ